MRHDAQHRLARLFFQKVNGRRQQRYIPAEFVDDQPLDEGTLILIQQLKRTDK